MLCFLSRDSREGDKEATAVKESFRRKENTITLENSLQEGETAELTDFKKQMLALMLALHERVERTEAVQEQQDQALQVLIPRAWDT